MPDVINDLELRALSVHQSIGYGSYLYYAHILFNFLPLPLA